MVLTSATCSKTRRRDAAFDDVGQTTFAASSIAPTQGALNVLIVEAKEIEIDGSRGNGLVIVIVGRRS